MFPLFPSLSPLLFCSLTGQKTIEELMSTVDHTDIRGSGLTPAVMVVIRRELPRTQVASRVRGPSHRWNEGPPFRVPLDRRLPCLHALRSFRSARLGRRSSCGPRLGGLLDRHPDRPDEPEKLPRHGSDHLLMDLALRREPPVAAM